MKRISFLLLIVIFLFSCQTKDVPRKIEKIALQEFKMEGTNSRAIYAIDSEKMYYAGAHGEVGFTENGGITWQKNNIYYQDSIAPSFRSIASNGEAMFVLSISNPALLYKITKSTTTLVYTESHEKVFYDAMQFFDKQHGIAIGDQTTHCLSIITTSDGGNSWQKIPCKDLPNSQFPATAFAASNTNIKIIGNTIWIAIGGMESYIVKSTDKGKTWKTYTTPLLQGKPSTGIYSIDFADKNHGIIIGGDYANPLGNLQNKAITTDGGKTWTLVADGENPNYKSCVQYVPDTNGKEVFAVGKTGISFSNDGGKSWKEVSKEAYYTIQFVDKNVAWLAGNEKIGKLILKKS